VKAPKVNRRSRRAAIVVLSALLLVFMLGLVAFAVDLGYIVLVRTELQAAADSAALAGGASMGFTNAQIITAAQQFAAYHKAGGKSVSLASSDVEFGSWDTTSRTFTPVAQYGNSVRVTVRRNNTTGGNNLFFGRVFGLSSFNTQASAIATANPRDIAFVVDLSGSMNDDTEPCWATQAITSEFSPQGYPTVGTDMMRDIFTDFGFGTFPGTLQWVGRPTLHNTGLSNNQWAYTQLSGNAGYLRGATIPVLYRINSGDNQATRKLKTYRWIIDFQLATLMPAARPLPSSATNYAFWEKYLDYVIQPVNHSGSGQGGPNNRGALPPSQWSNRIDGLNNPNNQSFPSANDSVPQGFRNQVGYRTFVQFMLDFGREYRPDGSNYVALSTNSPNCRYHNEATAGGTFSFPPREQPTHAARRSLIAGIQEIKLHNTSISDPNQRDWVSVITFDTNAGTVLRRALTGNYDTAMQSCTTMQAVSDTQSSTATETGLIAARDHILPNSQGGDGRNYTQKVVVLLTDGMPNAYSSSASVISAYRTANPSSDYYGGSNYHYDAALMQAMTMQLENWKVFPVGLGLGCDYGFMDRMGRVGDTADSNGESPRTSGNPIAYEQELTEIFRQIISNPQVRLVK